MAEASEAASAGGTHVHTCAHAHTGRTRVAKALTGAASVRRIPDGCGPWLFACSQSRSCLWLGVSGTVVESVCGQCSRRARKPFCMKILDRADGNLPLTCAAIRHVLGEAEAEDAGEVETTSSATLWRAPGATPATIDSLAKTHARPP